MSNLAVNGLAGIGICFSDIRPWRKFVCLVWWKSSPKKIKIMFRFLRSKLGMTCGFITIPSIFFFFVCKYLLSQPIFKYTRIQFGTSFSKKLYVLSFLIFLILYHFE